MARRATGRLAEGRDDRDQIAQRQNNAREVLFLLQSAQGSLIRMNADAGCVQLMADCIDEFQRQHNVGPPPADDGIVWEETTSAAVLRLLEYLHREIADVMGDHHSARQLRLCIVQFSKVALH
jgi:hypothetical protein